MAGSRMLKKILTLGVLILAAGACGPAAVQNDEAPVAENVVFAFEFGAAALAWRDDSHQVVIGFTDELNQSDDGVDKWKIASFCSRAKDDRTSRTVHMVWSGEVSGGTPTAAGGVTALAEDPFGAAACTGGTSTAISSDASNLDLSTLPVTKALKGSVLVEYLTDTPDTATEVSVVIKTATADGEGTFTRKLSKALDTKTVDDSSNADIPADAVVDVPTPSINNVVPKAEFSQIEGNPGRLQVNFLGLIDPSSGETINLVANESIFIADGNSRSQKGLKITRGESNSLPVDILFAIDNSGSMGEEADKVAEKIKEFASTLVKSGVDAKFAVIGFNGGITGAIDFTDVGRIESFLNRDKGTMRTGGFEGSNADALEEKAGNFDL